MPSVLFRGDLDRFAHDGVADDVRAVALVGKARCDADFLAAADAAVFLFRQQRQQLRTAAG